MFSLIVRLVRAYRIQSAVDSPGQLLCSVVEKSEEENQDASGMFFFLLFKLSYPQTRNFSHGWADKTACSSLAQAVSLLFLSLKARLLLWEELNGSCSYFIREAESWWEKLTLHPVICFKITLFTRNKCHKIFIQTFSGKEIFKIKLKK